MVQDCHPLSGWGYLMPSCIEAGSLVSLGMVWKLQRRGHRNIEAGLIGGNQYLFGFPFCNLK